MTSSTDVTSSFDTAARKTTDIARETLTSASEMARDTSAKAQQAVADTASTATSQVKDLLDRQIGNGVGLANRFAKSVRLAADDLQDKSPLLAGAIDMIAGKVEQYADDMQDRTIDHLARSATDFTRHQPAVVFGLAALAGFFVYRAVKAAPPIKAPSIQPSDDLHQG